MYVFECNTHVRIQFICILELVAVNTKWKMPSYGINCFNKTFCAAYRLLLFKSKLANKKNKSETCYECPLLFLVSCLLSLAVLTQRRRY